MRKWQRHTQEKKKDDKDAEGKEVPEEVPHEELSGVQMGGPPSREIPRCRTKLMSLDLGDPVKDFPGEAGIIIGMTELSDGVETGMVRRIIQTKIMMM